MHLLLPMRARHHAVPVPVVRWSRKRIVANVLLAKRSIKEVKEKQAADGGYETVDEQVVRERCQESRPFLRHVLAWLYHK